MCAELSVYYYSLLPNVHFYDKCNTFCRSSAVMKLKIVAASGHFTASASKNHCCPDFASEKLESL